MYSSFWILFKILKQRQQGDQDFLVTGEIGYLTRLTWVRRKGFEGESVEVIKYNNGDQSVAVGREVKR